MFNVRGAEPIDYLIVGHLTQDLAAEGFQLGGTAAYAALTAKALGFRVGVVTSWNEEISLPELEGIPVAICPAEQATTFENRYAADGRTQILHHLAEPLDFHLIPETWRTAPVVHLAPVAQELPPNLVRLFPNSFLGLTPQGWLRRWEADGLVRTSDWPEADFVLRQVDAAVLSLEDIQGNTALVQELAASANVLVVTEGAGGATVYSQGEVQHLDAPSMDESDATGAGDIFAAAFFLRMNSINDPLDAARFANQVAAISVTRPGLEGIVTPDEIYDLMTRVA